MSQVGDITLMPLNIGMRKSKGHGRKKPAGPLLKKRELPRATNKKKSGKESWMVKVESFVKFKQSSKGAEYNTHQAIARRKRKCKVGKLTRRETRMLGVFIVCKKTRNLDLKNRVFGPSQNL